MTALAREAAPLAAEIERALDRLWPLMRSITGPGLRRTYDILGEIAPTERIEVPTGTTCFDWTVPKEWRVNAAYIVGPDGRRRCDVADNTLHLVNYSVPFRGRLSRAALERHLHSRPDMPDAVPYVTSYYEPRWGFCLSERERAALPEGTYEVVVDTALVDGSLTIAEAVLPGAEADEVLISAYCCHPSMANNELSGPLVAAFLHRCVAGWPRRRLTYRFVFCPETIGAIAYLAVRGAHLKARTVAGYVLTCLGDPGPFTYKRARRAGTLADRAALAVLKGLDGPAPRILDFDPADGSDERQYASPGFDLPVGSLMRTMYGRYPEYHTSLDNRDCISFDALARSVLVCEEVLAAIDANRRYLRRNPYGEPQLGRRGLYDVAGHHLSARQAAIMWVLNFADGDHDLLAISERSGIAPAELAAAARLCLEADLIVAAEAP